MKKSIIISALLLPGASILFSSNGSGPAMTGNGIRNGGPFSNGNCASCHSGGAGTTTISISLKDKATGAVATGAYQPGALYTVTISGNNTNLALFGFQVSAALAGNQQAGSFSNMGSDKHISTQSNLQIVEHSNSLAKTNGGYEASFDWTAPTAGVGTVTFYGIINGVNGNNAISGDKASAPATLTLTEGAGGTNIVSPDPSNDFKVYPNPATNMLHIRLQGAAQGQYRLQIIDMSGKTVYTGGQYISAAAPGKIATAHLPAGSYNLQLQGKAETINYRFMKQ